MTARTNDWPGVRPEVVAEVVAGLSARLQKRLDGAAAKLAQRPVAREGDEWRVEVDEETVLVLHAPGGVVAAQADVRCGCLLAPACVHRAAAVTLCPIAEAEAGTGARAGAETRAGAGVGVETRAGAGVGVGTDPEATPTATGAPGEAAERSEESAEQSPAATAPTPLTAAERAAARHLHRAAAAVLAAGVSGAGAVSQAELLRAAHRARLAGLYRPAAAAVTVATRVRAARSGAPDHRLVDLVAGLRELLGLTTALASGAAPAPELRGTARQAYREEGGLRLYGLFTEPVLTATHAGAVSWAVDADGRLSTIAEVLPHEDAAAAAPQAVGAGNRTVRLGDAALSHREFSRAGLVVQGATRSTGGRLGAGASVRAVRATGTAWTAEPASRLWSEPVPAQVARALAAQELPYESRPAGSDLLFLDVTLLGTAPTGPGGTPQLLARCTASDSVIVLRPAHEHPDLPFRANLALLATAPGLRLRAIGRLERADRPELRLLAIGASPDTPGPLARPADRAGRVNLGLERLQTADLVTPETAPETATDPTPMPTPTPTPETAPEPTAPVPYGPPVHVLGRRVEQTVTTGRHALAPSEASAAADRALLRAAGLATAAELLDALRAAAADRQRDVFGRIVTDDHDAFATVWLTAASYTEELATALCAAAWSGEG
ncbi:hypothetical protein [Kitasatospora brasiliensis]|uniref:hypothetical protein n=1 Tax=Kitasatospora brasiliensis TaxID=3058040 RepID=UPI00292DCCAD|nr:hypothetical protein [Kitasatospora sp. K002]